MEPNPPNPTAKGPAQNFAGDVYVTPVYSGQEPSRMTVALVRFTPGAHTNWHRHAVGQTLHVTEGVGLVGTRDGTVLRILVSPGDVLVLICRGPIGAGMEEIYQITSALKFLPFGKHVVVITDARFSGVSTGACIGHVGAAEAGDRSGRPRTVPTGPARSRAQLLCWATTWYSPGVAENRRSRLVYAACRLDWNSGSRRASSYALRLTQWATLTSWKRAVSEIAWCSRDEMKPGFVCMIAARCRHPSMNAARCS